MRPHYQNQIASNSASITRPSSTGPQSSKYVGCLAVLLAMSVVGLSSCGYTGASRTTTGTPGAGVLSASNASLSFGNVNVGSTGALTAVVTNNGDANVTISSMTSSAAGVSASGLSSGEVLTPNQSATVTVDFNPPTAGEVTGSVSIASDATNSPTIIAVSGTGVAVTHSVTLSWSPSVSPVSGYDVYRGTTSGGPYSTKLNSSLVTTTQFTDSTVVSGQTYYYVVTAVNSSNVESTDSNQTEAVIP
ncbi:MAG: choice-of-anchor D domain-containing protein [Candidatus Acidiferrales bacterium]